MRKSMFVKPGVIVSAIALTVAMSASAASAAPVKVTSTPEVIITAAGAALGIHALLASSAANVVPDQPASHSGCNGNVCIDVVGSGTSVSSWGTSASGASCSYAYFYVNGTKVAQSASCYSGNTPEVTIGGGTYSPGTELCNGWSGVSGYPCAEIES
jgi:hypothetical protein